MTPAATTNALMHQRFDLQSANGAALARKQVTHLAHAPEWLEIIQDVYGHRPLLLRTSDSGGTAFLPAVIVRRPLLGQVVASMPFLDGGGPSFMSAEAGCLLVKRLVADARALGARAVDVRSSVRLDIPWTPLSHKANLVLPLPSQPDELWASIGRGVRNEVRKAERSSLTVERAGPAELAAFYEVYAARMHDLGSPAHSRAFFDAIFRVFGDRARLILVRKDSRVIGGLVALVSGDTVTVPWASCLREYFSLCPNMLLYWEAIRSSCSDGFAQFDFGRSTRDSGTWRFKRQWGAVEQPLFWYSISLSRKATSLGSDAPSHTRESDRAAAAWRRLPQPITRWLGPRLRKYLVQ